MQGALHGNETFSTPVLLSLIEFLRTNIPCIPVRIVPRCNPWAFDELCRGLNGRISSSSGRNWNRIFGGDAEETSRESILASELMKVSEDFGSIVDVHTPEFGLPHVYVGSSASTFDSLSDLPHIIAAGTPNSFEDWHRSQGRRSVTIELPSHTVPSLIDVTTWRDRLLEIIANIHQKQITPTQIGHIVDVVSPIDGIPILHFEVGETVSAGAPLVDIVATTGSVGLLAKFDCLPICFRRQPLATANSWILRAFTEESDAN
ncbi:succinylglutamate desuccinylase/aspartoacylase family protein [Amycolatopsis sp. NPDC004747]